MRVAMLQPAGRLLAGADDLTDEPFIEAEI
jgi:hypothetical protein